MKYRDLLSEKNFLRVQQRARALNRDGTNLIAILYSEHELIFKTASGTYGKSVMWTQRISITDALLDNIKSGKSFSDIEKLIRESDLKVDCNCLQGDTRVLTNVGYKCIKDIVTGDIVLGSDGQWHEAKGLLKSEVKNNWVKLHIQGMRNPLIVTTDHKLLFSSYRDFCCCGCNRALRHVSDCTRVHNAYKLYHQRRYIPKHSGRPVNDNFERYQLHSMEQYKLGELLCSPIVKGSVQFDPAYARMLGYYLAEGSMNIKGSTVKITLNQNEEDTIAADIVTYFNSVGVSTRLHKVEYKQQKWLDVIVYSKQFKEDCSFYCGKGSKTKSPNPVILSWCDEAKESFLIGHLLGDGFVDDSFRWLSTSGELVDMLQLILNSIGVHASTYICNNARGIRSTLYAVSATINSFYLVYSKYLHLFRQKDLINPNKSAGQLNMADYSLYKITDIEDVEPQCGYDILLSDEPHMYVAGNVCVSNCPADLYWGYKYIRTRKGAALVEERRRPVIRNPFERGNICKHLYLVLQLYPFWSKALASKFYKWAKSKEGALVNQNMGNLARVRMNQQNQKYVNQLSNPSGAPAQNNVTTIYNQSSAPQQVSLSDLE